MTGQAFEPIFEGSKARRCPFLIEKEWPGHRVVLWRRQCKNMVKPPYRYCHVHRYKEMPAELAS